MRHHIAWGLCSNGDEYADRDLIESRIAALSARDLWALKHWYNRTTNGTSITRMIRGHMSRPIQPRDGSWAATITFFRHLDTVWSRVHRCRFQHVTGCNFTRRGPPPASGGYRWFDSNVRFHNIRPISPITTEPSLLPCEEHHV